MSDANVPCNGCTLCCHRDAVRLLPEDDPAAYQTEPHEYRPGQRMLAHAPNGDCVYLGPSGCTIYERRPLMCREMDCRNVFRALTWTRARKGRLLPVWKRGRLLARVAP